MVLQMCAVAFPLLILIRRKPEARLASRKAANYVKVLSDYKFVAAISCLWLAHEAFERLPGETHLQNLIGFTLELPAKLILDEFYLLAQTSLSLLSFAP